MITGLERSLVLTVLLVTAAARAEANAGAPRQGGERAGEPAGISGIAIVREELVIDLRPLAATSGLVAVTATYHLDNPSDEKHLDLVFATGSAAAAFRAALDGRPVPSAFTSGADLPESWRPPHSTQRFDGGEGKLAALVACGDP
jgi:hypothetical protein